MANLTNCLAKIKPHPSCRVDWEAFKKDPSDEELWGAYASCFAKATTSSTCVREFPLGPTSYVCVKWETVFKGFPRMPCAAARSAYLGPLNVAAEAQKAAKRKTAFNGYLACLKQNPGEAAKNCVVTK